MDQLRPEALERILNYAPRVVEGCHELEAHLSRLRTTHVDGQLDLVTQRLQDLIDRLLGDLQTLHAVGDATVPQRQRVMIVDDSFDNRDAMATAFRTAGFATLRASNGLEAIVLAHTARPDVIIMDVSMPVLDGVAATRLLKADAATRNVPVVAFTAHPASCQSLKPTLFAEVASKPASSAVLVAIARKLTEPHRI